MGRKIIVGTCVALTAAIVLGIVYWPHLLWKTAFAKAAYGVEAARTETLNIPPPTEPMSRCTIGPFSFIVPTTMTGDIAFRRGIGGLFVMMTDGKRRANLMLPEPDDRWLQSTIVGFPEKAQLSMSRLHKEMCEASSANFSFGMSRRELGWHSWLLVHRQMLPDEIGVVEYLFRENLEGHLWVVSIPAFQWSTPDNKWCGYIHFRDVDSPDSPIDWMRQVSGSIKLDGDASVFATLDEASAKEMMTVAEERSHPADR